MLYLLLVTSKIGVTSIMIFFLFTIKLSKNSKYFFDIGAHIGIVSLSISRNISENGLIYAFEPSKTNLKFLKYHISSNCLKI